MIKINYHLSDILFRILFSLIFIGLGLEHIFSNELITRLMPDWLVYKSLFAILSGIVLLGGGFSIMFGCQVKTGAWILMVFLLTVTSLVHLPAVFSHPVGLPQSWHWLWDIYQRSNLVKNLCLIGVCIHLTNHEIGKFSIQYLRENRHV